MSGLPFQGETMTCSLCGATRQSDPTVESQWDALQTGGLRLYYCPNHRVADKVAHFDRKLKEIRDAALKRAGLTSL
jgi:hypothetical protein